MLGAPGEFSPSKNFGVCTYLLGDTTWKVPPPLQPYRPKYPEPPPELRRFSGKTFKGYLHRGKSRQQIPLGA